MFSQLALSLLVTLTVSASLVAQDTTETVIDYDGTSHSFKVEGTTKNDAATKEKEFKDQYGDVWSLAKYVIAHSRAAISGTRTAATTTVPFTIDTTKMMTALGKPSGTWPSSTAVSTTHHGPQNCFVRISTIRVAKGSEKLSPDAAMEVFKTSFRDKRSWHYKPKVVLDEGLTCSEDKSMFIHTTHGYEYFTVVVELWNQKPELFSFWYETKDPNRVAAGIDAAFVVPGPVGKATHVYLVTVFLSDTDYSERQHEHFKRTTDHFQQYGLL